MGLATCRFPSSLDDHFIIDRHPEYPQVVFGAGFSGHGYEFASVIGEVLADLAVDGHTDPIPSACSGSIASTASERPP